VSDPELIRKSERRPDRAALVVGGVLLALAAVVAWDTSHVGGVVQYARIGPQTVPYVVAGCLALLGVWTIVQAVRGDFPARETQELRPVLWIVAALLVQIATLRITGFSIATGLMFGLVARGFGERRLWLTIPFGIVVSALIWLIFARGLSLSLPAGPLETSLANGLASLLSLLSPGGA